MMFRKTLSLLLAVTSLLLGAAIAPAQNKLNTLNGDQPTETAPVATEESQAPLTPEEEAEEATKSFVDGNLHFIVYHELGHALVSEFGLPVLGREEDAVDRLAIWMMTPNDREEPEYLKAAIQGWFASASQRPLEDIPWWGEHGTDEQRAYQIACLLYGWQPDRYKEVADSVDLPDQRRQTCEEEAKTNDTSWLSVLDPHSKPEGDPRSTGTVNILYEPTTAFADELAYLKDLGLLEHVAEIMEIYYKLEPGISVTSGECGEPNAFWVPGERKIIMCYELVADFRRMAETASN